MARRMTKYDPVYHHNVVENYRRLFKQKYGSDCILTDEEIWNIQEDCFFTENPEEDTLESMNEEEAHQTKKEKPNVVDESP
jgi:hypothetical protein